MCTYISTYLLAVLPVIVTKLFKYYVTQQNTSHCLSEIETNALKGVQIKWVAIKIAVKSGMKKVTVKYRKREKSPKNPIGSLSLECIF